MTVEKINIDKSYLKNNINKQNNAEITLNPNGSDRVRRSNSNYNFIFPSKKDLYVEATNVPDNYTDPHNINSYSKQYLLGTPEFLILQDRQIFNENSSYKSIQIPPHINLNHLCNIPYRNNSNNNVLITSSVQRVRNKFLTLVYYKPIS